MLRARPTLSLRAEEASPAPAPVPGSRGVAVQYTVLVPPGTSVASVAAAVQPAAAGAGGGGGGTAAAFAASVVANVQQLAAAASDATLSSGFANVGAVVAAPAAKPAPSPPSTDDGTQAQSRLGTIIGAACAGVIALSVGLLCAYCCGCCREKPSPFVDVPGKAGDGTFAAVNPLQARAGTPQVIRSAKGDRPIVGRGSGGRAGRQRQPRAAGESAV
jgi:hypothetical protein